MSEIAQTLHFDKQMLGDGIEFVGLITQNGRLLAGNGKNIFNLSEEQMEMFLMNFSLQQRMDNDYDDNFGQAQFTVTARENFRIIAIPRDSNTLIFVMDKNYEFLSRVKGLLDAIKHVKNL